MPRTLLITEAEIKSLTNLTTNVDSGVFNPFIPIAMDLNIKPATGTSMFNELIDQVENGTLTAANRTLLNGDGASYPGLKVALAWWILYKAYPSLYLRVTPTGVHKRIGTNIEVASREEVNDLKLQAKDFAEYYTNQLICYLRENSTDYPTYLNDEDCCTTPIGNGYTSTSGIVLDDDFIHDEFTRVNGSRL